MNKVIRRLAVVGTLGLAAGTTVVGTTPAFAGGCAGSICGAVRNASNSNATIPVTDNWTAVQGDFTSTKSMDYIPVSPGSSRGGFPVDVDGFFTSTACKTYGVSGFKKDGDGGRNRFTGPDGTSTGQLRNNLWIKIATDEQVTVRIVC